MVNFCFGPPVKLVKCHLRLSGSHPSIYAASISCFNMKYIYTEKQNSVHWALQVVIKQLCVRSVTDILILK